LNDSTNLRGLTGLSGLSLHGNRPIGLYNKTTSYPKILKIVLVGQSAALPGPPGPPGPPGASVVGPPGLQGLQGMFYYHHKTPELCLVYCLNKSNFNNQPLSIGPPGLAGARGLPGI
jgi:hypothetical protein